MSQDKVSKLRPSNTGIVMVQLKELQRLLLEYVTFDYVQFFFIESLVSKYFKLPRKFYVSS